MQQIEIENNVYEVKIGPEDLSISRAEIEFNIGYPENTFPAYFSGLIDEITEKFSVLSDIKAGYCIKPFSMPKDRKDGFIVEDVFFETEKIVVSQLRGSESAAFFVGTIGAGMEKWSRQLLENVDPAKSYLVDCVASAYAEAVANYLHNFIAETIRASGLKVTNRYSPGYCKWPVSDQHKLFSFFPSKFCGISLSESALMSPIKSVSGIIGVGANVQWREYLCDRCGVGECVHRAKRLEKMRYKK